ncbi:MAG: GTP 3',8-cyclase MoaA [Bacteroidota bacterium]|nr:GTP 3',8-cyclase MoaA [Bacteroidota bacterium]
MLYDNHGRPLNYLRLAVTDRCNLRCFYCMPIKGVKYLPKDQLLTYEEMERTVKVMASMGITKVRITGGEPFVRQGLMDFMWRLREIKGLEEINLTTNGVLTGPYIPELKRLGISSVNLSLDTLNKESFYKITYKDELEKVLDSMQQLLAYNIPVKINAVVMEGKNTDQLQPLIELTKNNKVDLRFIEEMPFNGSGQYYTRLQWDHVKILESIKSLYPDLQKAKDPTSSTAYNYSIPGHKGKVGIIAAFSRTFCGTCNRVRLTSEGKLKTCLYDEGVLDLKKVLREGVSDESLKQLFLQVFNYRAKNGFEAESRRTLSAGVSESMSTIGG